MLMAEIKLPLKDNPLTWNQHGFMETSTWTIIHQEVMFLTCTWEFPSSYLGRFTDYPKIFHGSPVPPDRLWNSTSHLATNATFLNLFNPSHTHHSIIWRHEVWSYQPLNNHQQAGLA
jgi:hypothetical protein